MMDEDFAMVRDLGCTGVRLPHYEHADYEYSLCDRLGLLVWAELALVNRVTDTQEFADITKSQLRELIKQNYNHPSILFWSMYNEPGIDRKRGDQEWHLVDSLVSLAHELDPTRPTTGAVSMSAKPWLDWVMDVTSFNRYWGWYDGAPSLWKTRLDALKAEAGGRSFGISEYGAGASVNQHESDPKQPKTGGSWHPEEWQSVVHEAAWPELESRPWIWCKLLWVMFDFPSSGRNEGDQGGINDKGLVTGDRKIRKDAFFYYKACWTDKPMVYITERRYSPRPAGTYSVKVYSNCPSVELWVDGKSVGAVAGTSHVFVWPGVVLETGIHELRATEIGAPEPATDSIKIVAAPPQPGQ
jgi:beta-galactosidase